MRALLIGGLSGRSLVHSDIGGYTMIDQYGLKYLRSTEVSRDTELVPCTVVHKMEVSLC